MGEVKQLPYLLNADSSFEKIKSEESPFIKDLGWDTNANGQLSTGTGNPTGEGQNAYVLTPSRANKAIDGVALPDGFNKCCLSFESIVTNEFYYGNYNSNGNHGLYVVSGDTLEVKTIIIDPNLDFTDDADGFYAEHRVRLRVRYDENKNIIEKYLIGTNGKSWQLWINVIAATETNGFDVSVYPYWTLYQPHFDRKELLQYAVRPPMFAPIIAKIPNTPDDRGKVNQLLDTAFEICYQDIYTDGRETTTSPFSLPLITKKEDFLSNPDIIPKKALVKMYAGSCMLEKRNIFFRKTALQSDSTLEATFSPWYLYETIYKFGNCGQNAPEVIGNKYWLRSNQWENYNYNPVQNTIDYIFDNSKLGQIVGQELFNRIQNDIPQLSTALSDIGDAILLGGNRSGYDNFGCNVTDSLKIDYIEKNNDSCIAKSQKIRLYVYAGRDRGNGSNDNNGNERIGDIWHSQVGYYVGEDTQMRWGGMFLQQMTIAGLAFDVEESKLFDLDFADKNGFRCYLKGTPYYADCQWYQVKKTFELVKINGLIDADSASDKQFVLDVYSGGGFFVGVFDFVVPAGKYIAAIGRHNVSNDNDYRSQSTYVMGIANSRGAALTSYFQDGFVTVNTVKPNAALISTSKEMEVDCTNGDVDVWGNGADLFYVCTPFQGSGRGRNRWSFIEGYLTESDTSPLGVERFPYNLSDNPIGRNGEFTDKNGFFWGYSWGGDIRHNFENILFTVKLNCTYPRTFTVLNNRDNSPGWKPENNAKLSDYNGGVVGNGNRMLLNGRITDISGLIGYSNIGISIKDGATVYTRDDGTFTLIVHNGQVAALIANVYINAGGNFNISTDGCGFIPLFVFNENILPCQTVFERTYPTELEQQVVVQGGELQSLKSNGIYLTGIAGADLAGRVTYVSIVDTVRVKSFPERNNTLATQFNWSLLGALNLNSIPATTDIKYISFFTTLANNYKKYIQWVGDAIDFIDAGGNVTSVPSNASLVRISITSLLNANINQNFTILSNYQFVKGDRMRVFDNGEGELYDTATYGDVIDVALYGNNYNQAAVNANVIAPPTNTVLPSSPSTGTDPVYLYAKYSRDFDKLKDHNGFWIELYTPFQQQDKVPYFQMEGWMPIINGEIAMFDTLDSNNQPVFTFPSGGNLNFWDTYLINRNISIPLIGNKNLGHLFESPNISDTWGVNAQSGGRANKVYNEAAQTWYLDEVIKSLDFITEGRRNGLGTFLSSNKKNFKGSQRGGIVVMYNTGSNIIMVCTKDWMVVDYNYNFLTQDRSGNISAPSAEGNIGVPHQKIGDNYGIDYDDTRTVVIHEKFIAWLDKKNSAFVMCDYQNAMPISDNGMQSYFFSKSEFVSEWNGQVLKKFKFDTAAGIDMENMNIYVTFRPRRDDSQSLYSFVNRRRNVQLDFQETLVYNIESKRWTRFMGCTPEAYGKLRGNASGVEMISFAAGKPYFHLKTPNNLFATFYGIYTEPVAICVLNANPDTIKVLQCVSQDTNDTCLWIDEIYSVAPNSYTLVPFNFFVKREGFRFATVLRDGASYPPPNKDELFRSMFFDGKKMVSPYFIVRYVWDKNKAGQYGEVNSLNATMIPLVQKQQ